MLLEAMRDKGASAADLLARSALLPLYIYIYNPLYIYRWLHIRCVAAGELELARSIDHGLLRLCGGQEWAEAQGGGHPGAQEG